MQSLYFIRHGQTQDNVDNVFGSPDTPLTDLGRDQARIAGRDAKAKSLDFDVIICSAYPRAVETAMIVAQEIGYPSEDIETSNAIVERYVGELTGTPYADFFGDKQAPKHIYKDIDDLPGVETVAALQQRANEVLASLKARPEQSILVVSHAAFGRALTRAVKGIPYDDEFRNTAPHGTAPNATIIRLI